MKTSRYTPGTRVRIRAGSFPMDAALLDRAGLILEIDEYRPRRYGVVLDGETEVRDFTEEELEPVEDVKTEDHMGDAGPGIGPKNA